MKYNGKPIRVSMLNWTELHLDDGRVYTKTTFSLLPHAHQEYLYSREVKDMVEEDGMLILYV